MAALVFLFCTIIGKTNRADMSELRCQTKLEVYIYDRVAISSFPKRRTFCSRKEDIVFPKGGHGHRLTTYNTYAHTYSAFRNTFYYYRVK